MLPAVLTLRGWTVFVLGRGPAALRRLAQVEAAGADDVLVFSPGAEKDMTSAAGERLIERWPTDKEWQSARLAFVAGEGDVVSQTLAEAARQWRVLVNVEDVPVLCDFYMPSILRRGDLMLAVSTGGKAPGLGQAIRRDLETRFGPEWALHVEEIAALRQEWRAAGLSMKVVAEKTKTYLLEKGWL